VTKKLPFHGNLVSKFVQATFWNTNNGGKKYKNSIAALILPASYSGT
jgi:hypothetical protein